MDGFGDNFDDTEIDPAADFLAREQDQLAGLEDELKPAAMPLTNGTTAVTTESASGSFEMINSLGQNEPDALTTPEVAVSEDTETFNDFDPALQAAPVEDPKPYSSPASHKPISREEPEKIKKWREDQKMRLEEKDENEEKKKLEWHESAKKELEEWYKHHEELIAKTKAANRNAEKQFVAETDAIEPGTEWERIAKLCDFNPKSSRTSKDVSRMRSIILQLKQAPPAAKQG